MAVQRLDTASCTDAVSLDASAVVFVAVCVAVCAAVCAAVFVSVSVSLAPEASR